jgi:hypothetical protein
MDDELQQRPYNGDFLCADCEDKIFNNSKFNNNEEEEK